MTPNEQLRQIEETRGLSIDMIRMILKKDFATAKKMYDSYMAEKEMLRQTMQLLYDIEVGR